MLNGCFLTRAVLAVAAVHFALVLNNFICLCHKGEQNNSLRGQEETLEDKHRKQPKAKQQSKNNKKASITRVPSKPENSSRRNTPQANNSKPQVTSKKSSENLPHNESRRSSNGSTKGASPSISQTLQNNPERRSSKRQSFSLDSEQDSRRKSDREVSSRRQSQENKNIDVKKADIRNTNSRRNSKDDSEPSAANRYRKPSKQEASPIPTISAEEKEQLGLRHTCVPCCCCDNSQKPKPR